MGPGTSSVQISYRVTVIIYVREASRDHIGISVGDGSAFFMDLMHVHIDLLSRGRVLENYLLLLVRMLGSEDKVTNNIFRCHSGECERWI